MFADHARLVAGDECFYFGEYTARKGFAFSEMNNLILNLKKSVDLIGSAQWRWKEKAIVDASQLFREALSSNGLFTLIPIPPSKAKNDPLYDDRMLRILHHAVDSWIAPDIRELVLQRTSTDAVHLTDDRPALQTLIDNYFIDEEKIYPIPVNIFIIDDVLTTGCHFKAMQHILRQQFPNANIYGIFIARRVPEAFEFSPINIEDIL